MSGYNGWSNFETWSIFVYFTPESKNDVDFAKDCVEEAFTDLPGFLRPFVDASRIDWDAIYASVEQDGDEQDEPAIPTIILCPCTEWVRENMGVDFSGVDTGLANLAADAFMQELEQLLSQAGFNVIYGTHDLTWYHTWKGHRWFRQKFGVAATYDCLTDAQSDLVYDLIAKAQEPKATLEKISET